MRKSPARSLPIKHRASEGDSIDSRVSSCEFPDVPASACLPSVSDGREGLRPGPTLPWGPPQLQEPVASHPPFWWPHTIWAQLKAQPPESWSKEGDTGPGPCEVRKQSALPSALGLPGKKAHFPWPFAQNQPIASQRPARKPSASKAPLHALREAGGPGWSAERLMEKAPEALGERRPLPRSAAGS